MKKTKYVITADSGCCPGTNILTKNSDVIIKEIPTIIVDKFSNEYKDLIDITPKEIIDRNKSGEQFTTASPLVSDYIDTFNEALDLGNDVFHVSMGENISSSSLSNSHSQANDFNEKYGKHIYVIDSKSGATAGKLIVTLIEKLINEGYSSEDIYNFITNDYIPNIQTSFVVPDVTGFIRSGRNKTKNSNLNTMKSSLTQAAGKALNKLKLQTQVDVKNGELHAVRCFRGKDDLALLNLLKNNLKEIKKAESEFIVYGTILSNEKAMEKAKEYIEDLSSFDMVIRKDISSVVAAYGDPNLCGISYVKKRLIK